MFLGPIFKSIERGLRLNSSGPRVELDPVNEIPEEIIEQAGEPTINTENTQKFIVRFYDAPVGYAIKDNDNKIMEIKIFPRFRGTAKWVVCKAGIDSSWKVRTRNQFGNFNTVFPRVLQECENT